jgi:hypothetical protein
MLEFLCSIRAWRTFSGAAAPAPLLVIVTSTLTSPLKSGSVIVTVAPAWNRSPTRAIRGSLACSEAVQIDRTSKH